MRDKKANVSVYYPEAKEGIAKLDDIMTTIHAELVANWIIRQNCSVAEKK